MGDYAPDKDADKKEPQPGEAGFFGTTGTSGPTAVVYDANGERQTYEQPSNYNPANAWGLIQNLKQVEGGIDTLKEDLYWAGYYGTTKPTIGGDLFDREDEAILIALMDEAASNGYTNPLELLRSKAAPAKASLTPLGTTLSPEDNPVVILSSLADQNGIKLSREYIAQTAAAISSGSTDVETESMRIREKIVAQAYPAWRDEIMNGANVADIATPYVESMAEILEIPTTDININDPALKKALQGMDANGKPAYTPLWKFQDDLREDPRWQYTDNAYATISNTMNTIKQRMGF